MSDYRIDLMDHGKINKAVNYMMIPATVGLLVNGLYNIVDTMFVAWLGTSATGATQVVMPIMVLISAIGLCLGVGAGSYVSRLLGMKKFEEANRVASTAVATSVVLGLSMSLLLLVFLEPVLKVFGASEETLAYSITYGRYIALAAVFTITSITLNNMLRAEGSASLSMIGQGVGAILNIILDPILIYAVGMGIEGAAIATMFSRFVTMVILLSRYLMGKSVVKLGIKSIMPSLSMYREVLKIGMSTFFRQLFYSICIGIMNNTAVIYGGQTLLASVGILLRITLLMTFLIFGISQGMQPVIGYNYGAGKTDRVRATFRYTLLVGTLVSILCALGVTFFSRVLVGIFRPEPQVMTYAVIGLRYYAFTFILMGFINIVTSFFQAIGKSIESLVLSISRQGFIFIPVIFLLPLRFGIEGILAAQLVSDLMTMVLTVFMFRPYMKLMFGPQGDLDKGGKVRA